MPIAYHERHEETPPDQALGVNHCQGDSSRREHRLGHQLEPETRRRLPWRRQLIVSYRLYRAVGASPLRALRWAWQVAMS